MKIAHTEIYYNKLLLFLIYLNSATILVPDKFKGWPIGLLLLVAATRYFKLKNKPILDHKKLIISVGFFIFLIFSITYTNDVLFAIRKLETGASLLVFPLIFYCIGNDKVLFSQKNIDILKLVFIFSLLLFLISSFTYFYLTEPFYTFKSTLVHYTNLVNIRIKYYEIHSIYLSIYVGIAIVFTLDLIKKFSSNTQRLLKVTLVIFIVFLAILNKKGPIISLGILGLIFLVKSKFNYKQIISIFSIATVLVLFIIYVPKYNNVNRFNELFSIQGNSNSSTGIRIQIYQCAIKNIIDAPIFGYGWGDTKTVLNNCYAQKNQELLKRNYNSHNQFLGIFLSTGIIGFLAFMYYLYYVFKISYKKTSPLLFFLMLYFCLNMLTENVLEREDGVIVITLLINIFFFSLDNNTKALSNKN